MIGVRALNLSGLTESELYPVRCVISDERRERAGKFRFEADRVRCITAEGLLLYLLYTEYNIEPNGILLEQEKNGKPFLKKPEGTGLRFNLSHAGNWVVCALGEGCTGVDVEQIRETDQLLANAVMTPGEFAEWRNMNEKLKAPAFCRLWTLKESYSKYLGVGLALDFSRVQMITDQNGLLMPSGSDACRLRSYTLEQEYFLSLCVGKEYSRELDRDIQLVNRDAFLDFFRSWRDPTTSFAP